LEIQKVTREMIFQLTGKGAMSSADVRGNLTWFEFAPEIGSLQQLWLSFGVTRQPAMLNRARLKNTPARNLSQSIRRQQGSKCL